MQQVQPLGPDRLTEQFRGDRRIDAAGREQEDRLVSDLPPHAFHLLLEVPLHRPRRAAAADAEDEVADHLVAVNGVVHLGVVLEAVAAERVGADGGEAMPVALALAEQRVAQLLEVRRPLTVTESKWLIQTCSTGREAREERVRPHEVQLGVPPLPAAVNDRAAVVLGDLLVAEAEAEDGDVEVVDRLGVGGVLPEGRQAGAAGEDQALVVPEGFDRVLGLADLGEHAAGAAPWWR